ncbi:Mak10 subunit, NatC N-terminal acetyltransferase-domain-containing protein [Halteromyces radiatus]|uniref:Mak10 subunit, NatC N-terminal acetyltransferase-domain-containing protein n=1 Tax=Halteromyces radiatus TaxID=101107 RepID=UPI00221E94D0|nr:Mak10 subunit, NatC N-terminal acetyltransferase-domain-containing protein [Halteromyces radiatus]KAI8084806.1 Mak10 subunit, NatC N-terminal acetyltransferase-domain-containing protein [Halteromyces radiatus]
MSQRPVQDIRDGVSEMNINDTNNAYNLNLDDQSFMAPPWKDITSFLDQATQEMKEGELIHLQSFTLFDAMSAIEIMDPRMDTGMVIMEDDGDKKGADYDINQTLKPEELLWIMDQLLACEMAWLSGHSLAQTVYTCIYFHHVPTLLDRPPPTLTESKNLDKVMQAVLKAYILGSVKCCHHIWNEMVSGNIFEEEDFTTNLFGLSLYETILDMDVFNDIQLALRILKVYMDSNNSPVLLAIYQRLNARKQFLQSLIYLAQPQCSHINEAQTMLKKLAESLDEETAKDSTSILGSLNLGSEVKGAFDPNINRKLTSQAPPRTVSLKSHQQSYLEFSQTIQRLESICAITNFSSVASLMNYFTNFAGTKPYPDAFSRSKLNSLFYSDGCIFGKYPIGALVTGCVFDIIQPPPHWFQFNQSGDSELLSKAKTSLHRFLEQSVALPFVDYFKIQCHNRARQRRILCKVLGEWDILQKEARLVDKQFQEAEGLQNSTYFSIWVYTIQMAMMEQILLLGFELELYGDSEYITIYWYHSYLQSALETLHQQHEDKTTIHDYYDQERTAYSQYIQQLNVVKKQMSLGVLKLLLAMKKTGQWKQQPLHFDDPETRFKHRLKPFAVLSFPVAQDYTQFLQHTSIDHLTARALLDEASSYFVTAKKTLEILIREPITVSKTELCHDTSQKVLMSMVKTCVANNITILRLLKLGEDDSTKVMVTFKYDPWWPILQLQERRVL